MARTKNAELPQRRRPKTEMLSRHFLIWRKNRREDSGYFNRDESPRGTRIALPASGSLVYPGGRPVEE